LTVDPITVKLSRFGVKLSSDAGIASLIDDLGRAMSGADDLIMMGGGNPGHIDAVHRLLKEKLAALAADDTRFRELINIYDPSQGHIRFNEHCARLLRREYGWDVGPENICLTNGSQTAFFMLLNMFGGRYPDGTMKKIRFPLAPEYIGYADLGIDDDLFISTRPHIEYLEDRQFKYRVDFDGLDIGEETGAICLSRPTNPTGNVVTDIELRRLHGLAEEHDIPLIIDSAYGLPFPHIVYTEASVFWDERIIICLSLSKLGLPAVRTGIVIASRHIIKSLAAMNAVISLAPGSFGALLVEELVQNGDIIELGKKVVKPFYLEKANKTLACVHKELRGIPYRVHRPEGAMFLWVWFENMPISSLELYHRLKRRGVLIVSGHYFFVGLSEPWQHSQECIRVTYSQDDDEIARGLRVIGSEVRALYDAAGATTS
jgi:valine--pyruvate aminotransferase